MRLVNLKHILVWIGKPRDTPIVYEDLVDAQTEVASAQEEVAELEGTLEEIKNVAGPVCPEFMDCTHPSCNASYGAWEIANQALKKKE